VKTLRERVNTRKARCKDVAAGSRRHDEALRELVRRRNQQQLPHKPPGPGAGELTPPPVRHAPSFTRKLLLTLTLTPNRDMSHVSSATRASKGASAGVKTKNKYLQEFESVKAGHQRKQGKFPLILRFNPVLLLLLS
jgi:hypothetical protein